MKKFFGKLPVMITFVSLAVIMAVVYIGMLVRPVAIGMTYKGEVYNKEYSVKIKNGSEAVMSIEGETEDFTCRYIVKGREIVVIPEEMTDKEFEDVKEEVLEDWDMVKESPLYSKVSAFKVEMMDQEFKCTGSVVFAIVGGIVELVLLAGAGLSVFYFIKKKKA